MERLTHMDSKGWYINDQSIAYDERRRGKEIDRLAAYEAAGLEPEAVEAIKNAMMGKLIAEIKEFNDVPIGHLCELVEAEKNGRLVVLPTKTVFELTWDVGENCDFICPASVDGKGCCELCEKGKLFVYERPCCQDHIPQIGNTVFLTRKEAEAALEARESDSK